MSFLMSLYTNNKWSFSSVITTDKGMSSSVLTFFCLPAGAELLLEAGIFFPVARAKRLVGLFMVTPFRVSALKVELDFKIDLMVLAYGKHLEEMHVTLARFEKKRDENTTHGLSVRGDGVRICCDAVRSEGRRCHYDL
ncbi:hypothetical protein Tco_0845186 [Tanacetum coccineum]